MMNEEQSSAMRYLLAEGISLPENFGEVVSMASKLKKQKEEAHEKKNRETASLLGAGVLFWNGRVKVTINVTKTPWYEIHNQKPSKKWLAGMEKDRRLGVTAWKKGNVRVFAFAGSDTCFTNEDNPGGGWKIKAYDYESLLEALENLDKASLPEHPVFI